MSQREAFEAWFASSVWSQNETTAKLGAVTGWNAAIQHARDVAGRACLSVASPEVHPYADGYNQGAVDCYDAIKEALK